MPKLTVTFKIKVPFYINWYIKTMVFFCETFNTKPDYEKLNAIFNEHVKITQCK